MRGWKGWRTKGEKEREGERDSEGGVGEGLRERREGDRYGMIGSSSFSLMSLSVQCHPLRLYS